MKLVLFSLLIFPLMALGFCLPMQEDFHPRLNELETDIKKIQAKNCPVPEELERFTITISVSPCPDLSKLAQNFSKGLKAFEKNYGKVEGPFEVVIGEGLNVGYDPKNKRINFANVARVINMGLDSDDVQVHELFHMLSCQKYPDFCSDLNEERTAIAEATADLFAYELSKDECFGENYYKENSCVRNFHTDLDPNLIGTAPHVLGNIIVSSLLQEKVSQKKIRKFFEAQDYSLQSLGQKFSMIENPLQFETSNMVKRNMKDIAFTMKPGEKGSFTIAPDQALLKKYPEMKAKVLSLDGKESFALENIWQDNKLTVKVEAGATKDYSKYQLVFENSGKIVGSRMLYLQSR